MHAHFTFKYMYLAANRRLEQLIQLFLSHSRKLNFAVITTMPTDYFYESLTVYNKAAFTAHITQMPLISTAAHLLSYDLPAMAA